MSEAPLNDQSAPSPQTSTAPGEGKLRLPDLFGKILDRLPMSKLTAKMSYCIIFAVMLIIFTLIMSSIKTSPTDFPTSWDMRGIIAIFCIIFFVGIWDRIKGSKSNP
ncbi:hypothetical protein [Paenibacillus sp. Cedars]|uniref:hypothetical protein n=1 Tax=Paenibacillus sp. Cedars TaxID=1980674 RepID=UPI0011638EA3|nr:hypothetical protein [Paenibacillus sp. Cedars]AWP28694.1 hypothetical protein B9D94_19600 [Paenibacillus sp. Cedars]